MSEETEIRTQEPADSSPLPRTGEGERGTDVAPRVTVATVWLDGCSGCHMSFLDMDERLVSIASRIDLVYSPLIDTKTYPDHVDVALVEGAVSSEEDLEKIHRIRRQTGVLIAFGDCAVTANVPSMRNAFRVQDVYARGYLELGKTVTQRPGIPDQIVPKLLPQARPIHEYVPVDIFLQGCPPPADVIFGLLSDLLGGRTPDLTAHTRFGR